MRYSRIKPDQEDTFMHVYNRTAGSTGEFPFKEAEKEEFIRRIHLLAGLFVIEPISYQVMGNHYHILVHIPAEVPSDEETAQRYNHFYAGKREPIKPTDPRIAELASTLRDISEYMKALQQPYSRWFNRTRSSIRRGHLWSERFKNTILETGGAVLSCWSYIEMNPVRACMAASPAEYRFCSFGHWCSKGRHPFHKNVEKRVMPIFRGLLNVHNMEELRTELKKIFAYHTAFEAKKSPDQIDTAIAVAAEKEHFSTRLDRRVRYWVDGLVIGSEIFVQNTVASGRVQYKVKKRRLTRAIDKEKQKTELYCFKQLRVLLQ